MELPSLTIVIPNYNGRHHLERCLPAVRANAPSGTQVIVVDDGSTDDSTAWLATAYPWVTVIALTQNHGFCGAVNAGLRHANGDVIELLNNDTEVQPGWAEAALRHFRDPAIGSVAPLVLWMTDQERIDSAGQDYHACGWARNRGYGKTLSDEYLHARHVFGATGSSGFYRRELMRNTGGLWPIYGAYFEDTDLAFQYRWAGYECVYEPQSRVLHEGTATYGKQPEKLARLLARNEEIVFWTNLPARTLTWATVLHAAFQAIRLVRQLAKGNGRAFLGGKWQALMAWRAIARRRGFLHKLRHGRLLDLQLDGGANVVRHGWSWLRHRRSA